MSREYLEPDLIPALDASIERDNAAYRAGKKASYQGYHHCVNPFPSGGERAAWLKGWEQGERDREPATS